MREVALSLGAVEHPERISEIHAFFCDVRDLLRNHLGDGQGRRATHVTRFNGSFTHYPVLSEIAITYRCNLACTFCYAGCGTADATPGNAAREKHRHRWRFWRTGRRTRRDPIDNEMTSDEVMQVIEQLAEVGKVPSVSFTGGECTLRPELPDFIARAREKGMRVNIITNGIRCADSAYVNTLVNAGLTSAQVSLEGPSARIHDELTQRSGSLAKTIEGIQTLLDAGVHVHTNTTICDENVNHLCAIIDLAHELGLPHLSMNQLIPTGTPTLARHRRSAVAYANIGKYVLQAKRHAEQVGIGFHWYSPTPFCLFNPIALGLGNKGCAACDGLIHVSPAGDVLPCSSFARGVGNILEDGLETIWFGKDALYYKAKRQSPAVCRLCRHFALCQGACTLYWSEMGHRELYRATAKRVINRLMKWLGPRSRPALMGKEAQIDGCRHTA
jgi:radical SAM protein with 4Fe4S-binding SPASM domain